MGPFLPPSQDLIPSHTARTYSFDPGIPMPSGYQLFSCSVSCTNLFHCHLGFSCSSRSPMASGHHLFPVLSPLCVSVWHLESGNCLGTTPSPFPDPSSQREGSHLNKSLLDSRDETQQVQRPALYYQRWIPEIKS